MESREDIFLEEFNSKLEFSIIDGGSIRANYGDITRLMQEYSDKQSKPLLEEIERLKGENSLLSVQLKSTKQDVDILQSELKAADSDLDNIKIESSHEIADLVKTQQENEKQLDEYCHKLEAYIEHNNQLNSRISELENGMKDLNKWLDSYVPTRFCNIHPAKKIINSLKSNNPKTN